MAATQLSSARYTFQVEEDGLTALHNLAGVRESSAGAELDAAIAAYVDKASKDEKKSLAESGIVPAKEEKA